MTQVETASASAHGKPTENDDINRKQRWFRAYETNKARESTEQRQARQYYHDRQWTDAEVQRLQARGQQATVRNRIKRKIDFLVGVEQRLRRDPKAFPRTPQHEQDADTATAGLRYGCDINHWEKLSSDVMHDGLVTGIGVAMIGIDGDDPKMQYVPIDRFFYDPRSVLPDFSDARYLGLHLWLDIDEAKDRWPDYADRLESMIDATNVGASLQRDVDKEQQWGDFENRRVRIVEFWEKKREGWYYCLFTGHLELDGAMSPYLDDKGMPDCPYVAWSPYVDEKGDRYGMVRTMKSVQDEINYSASKILHRIATDRFFYEDGSIEDVDELGKQLARPDGKIRITRGEWGKSVGLVDVNGVKLQGETERFQMAVTEIENLGPNPGLVGRGEGVDGASGRALLAQRDSGMTELSPIFERHRDWKLRVYRTLWRRCKQAWTGQKWIRITDDDNAVQHIALNQYEMQADPQTGMPVIGGQNIMAQMDVDIILNEGPDSITVNEELMTTLSNLGEVATGPLGKVMIELSNAPNKERLLKMLDKATAPDPSVAALQQRMAHLEEMLKAAMIDKTVAEVENKRADTLSKLMAATTPQAPMQGKPDEFGNAAPPQPAPEPNLPLAFAAMQQFPLQFGRPSLEQQAEMAPVGPQPGQDDQNGQQQGGQPMGQPPMQGESMMPPGGQPPQMMPEQMASAGALPVNPGA